MKFNSVNTTKTPNIRKTKVIVIGLIYMENIVCNLKNVSIQKNGDTLFNQKHFRLVYFNIFENTAKILFFKFLCYAWIWNFWVLAYYFSQRYFKFRCNKIMNFICIPRKMFLNKTCRRITSKIISQFSKTNYCRCLLYSLNIKAQIIGSSL